MISETIGKLQPILKNKLLCIQGNGRFKVLKSRRFNFHKNIYFSIKKIKSGLLLICRKAKIKTCILANKIRFVSNMTARLFQSTLINKECNIYDEKLKDVIFNLQSGELLSEKLKELGFSTKISNIHIFEQKILDKNLEGVTFENCTFSSSDFKGSDLKNIQFNSCKFNVCSFSNTNIENCQFKGCEMSEVSFTSANMSDIYFTNTSIERSSFEDAIMSEIKFYNIASMESTHFLQAHVSNCSMESVNLKNVVFFNANNSQEFFLCQQSKKSHCLTNPVCAFLHNPSTPGITTPRAKQCIKNISNLVCLRISMSPGNVDPSALKEEIEEKFNIRDIEHSSASSRGKTFIRTIKEKMQLQKNKETGDFETKEIEALYEESEKILYKVFILSQHIDSIYLPGGEDVPSIFYGGDDKEDKNMSGNDYRRSIMEFALIDSAKKMGIPLMAICRGFQVLAVYNGAKLQNVRGFNPNIISITKTKKSSLQNNSKSQFKSAVAHSQGVMRGEINQEGELKETAYYSGQDKPNIVETVESRFSAASPIIASQFHPEVYSSDFTNSLIHTFADLLTTLLSDHKENIDVWQSFYEASKTRANKRAIVKQLRARVGRDS